MNTSRWEYASEFQNSTSPTFESYASSDGAHNVVLDSMGDEMRYLEPIVEAPLSVLKVIDSEAN